MIFSDNLFTAMTDSEPTVKAIEVVEAESIDDTFQDSDDDDDEMEEQTSQISPISSLQRKSIFKSARRLSGLPNMLPRELSPDQNLTDDELSSLRILLAKFPEPPDKIASPVHTSTYSQLSQSAAKYLKGFWGSSSTK